MKTTKISCPYCRATGYSYDIPEMIFAGIISVGIFPVLDALLSPSKKDSMFANKCESCRGKKYLVCRIEEEK